MSQKLKQSTKRILRLVLLVQKLKQSTKRILRLVLLVQQLIVRTIGPMDLQNFVSIVSRISLRKNLKSKFLTIENTNAIFVVNTVPIIQAHSVILVLLSATDVDQQKHLIVRTFVAYAQRIAQNVIPFQKELNIVNGVNMAPINVQFATPFAQIAMYILKERNFTGVNLVVAVH
jgi:hypothetical protein